jgi:RNase adaptor protein for sRNA GlmZ degradation
VTYDPTTDLGYVRLLINDMTDVVADQLFTDVEINAVLARDSHPKRAAGTLLMAMASNEAMLSKVIRTQDLQTDGAKLAAELRTQANELRNQATEDENNLGEPLVIIDFDPFAGYRYGELAEDINVLEGP